MFIYQEHSNDDILVYNSSKGKFDKKAKGTNGTFLGVSGGVLGYYTPAGGGGSTVIQPHTYLVYKDPADSSYKAQNGNTGAVDYTHATNVTSVLDSIIDAISPAGKSTSIILGPGDFDMTTVFNNIISGRIGNITIKGQGMGVTNLIATSSIASGTVFDILGAVSGSQTNLTANATSGAASVTVADASTLAAGDYILLRSNAVFSTAASAQGKKGEIRRIVSKATNTLTLDKWIHDTYNTADTANVIKLSMLKNITLQDFTLKAGSGYTGTGTFISTLFVDNLRMDRVEVQDHLGTGVDIRSCTNSYVDVVCTQTPTATFNSQYGAKPICASENVEFHIIGKGRYRHLFTSDASNTANLEGQPRGIKISGQGETCDEATWDTHATGEGYVFDNCTVMGTRNNATSGDAKGFQLRAKKSIITNCNIFKAIGKGITLMEDATGSIVSNNQIEDTRQTETSTLGYGIEIRSGCNDCVITGNRIRGSTRDGILMRTTSSGHVVTGNSIVSNGGDGINAVDVTNVTITGNKITDNDSAVTTTGTSNYWIVVANTTRTNTGAISLVGANNVNANNTT